MIRTLLMVSLSLLLGCSTTADSGGSSIQPTPASSTTAAVAEERQHRREQAASILQSLYTRQPKARQSVTDAYGYAVFRNLGMKLLVAGSGSGKGIAVENATGRETFMKMAEIQAGLGFGAKRYNLIWVFASRQAFDSFIHSGIEIGGQATVAAKAGDAGGDAAGAVQVADGVWVYQLTEDGLAAELTVKGTRYYRDRDLD